VTAAAAPLVKICGVTRGEDAGMVAAAGADWIGINFWPGSKRHVTLEQAAEVMLAARGVRRDVVLVGVFVDQTREWIEEVVDRLALDMVQLHGDQPAGEAALLRVPVIRAVALGAEADLDRLGRYPCAYHLVDTPSAGVGGSGRVGDWGLARQAVLRCEQPVLLAGGLTPDNVGDAIAAVRPGGVDVASGVESAPGIKDRRLVERFLRAVTGRTPTHLRRRSGRHS